MSSAPVRSIAEAEGRAVRFTDYQVPDSGIRDIYRRDSLWQAYLDVEVALAVAEADAGLVPPEAAEAIASYGRLERLDRNRVVEAMRTQGHPMVPLVSELARVVGPEAGGWVHWGATSQNIMQTGHALLQRRAHAVLARLVDACLLALADLGERGADMCMAGRTHGQHAVPITFGLKVATWIDDVVRARGRLEQAQRPCERAMMGGAVGSFASLGAKGPAIQRRVAELLGLDSMTVPSRALLDPQASYLCELALTSASFARMASDIETMMQTEFGEVSEPVPDGSVGSSTMPHKRNPKLCNDVLDLSAEIRALPSLGIAAMIHPHEADGRATASMDAALEEGQVALGDLLARMRIILAGLELFPQRMFSNLELSGDLIGSESVMLALAEDLGREEAHHVVYELAMRAAETGEMFRDLLMGDPRVAEHLDEGRIRSLLDPRAHVGLSADIAREAVQLARSTAGPRT